MNVRVAIPCIAVLLAAPLPPDIGNFDPGGVGGRARTIRLFFALR